MGLMFTLVAMFPLGAIMAGAAADVAGLRTVAVAEGLIVLALAVVAWFGVLKGIVTEREQSGWRQRRGFSSLRRQSRGQEAVFSSAAMVSPARRSRRPILGR
jgi:hypothetical protein